MNAEDLAATVRSAPGWLVIFLAILTVVLLIAAGPLAGLGITHRRHKETSRALAAKTAGPVPELEWMNGPAKPVEAKERRVLGQPFGALDVTFAGVPRAVDSSPTMLLSFLDEPATEPVPLSDEPSVPATPDEPIVPAAPSEPEQAEPLTEEFPIVEGEDQGGTRRAEMTSEWSIEAIFDAEVVEAEDEATRLFQADPLRSWVMPPMEEMDYLPEADKVFRDLVARNWLTGEGAEISIDWEPWYSDSRELEEAST